MFPGNWRWFQRHFPPPRLFLPLLACVLAAPVLGSAMTGEALARAVFERPEGRDLVVAGTMSLQGQGSRMRLRETYTYRLDGEGGASMSLIRFVAPANIAGTGLLVHDHADGATDQWLYLSAAKQVRRLSSENLGGSFVQSDLYFEDLQERLPEEDRHTLLGMDVFEGVEVYLLESVPVHAGNSAYSRRLSWVHPETLIPVRIDFFQGAEQPVKRFEVLHIENVQGYWTVMASKMTTLKTGHETHLQVITAIYDQALPAELFTVRALSDPLFEQKFRH